MFQEDRRKGTASGNHVDLDLRFRLFLHLVTFSEEDDGFHTRGCSIFRSQFCATLFMMLFNFSRSRVFSFFFVLFYNLCLLQVLCNYSRQKVMFWDDQQVVAKLYLPPQHSQVFCSLFVLNIKTFLHILKFLIIPDVQWKTGLKWGECNVIEQNPISCFCRHCSDNKMWVLKTHLLNCAGELLQF